MNDKIHHLKQTKPTPNAKTIEKLELLLAEAKTGQLIGFAAGVVYGDRTIGRIWSLGDASAGEVLGALTLLEHGIIGAIPIVPGPEKKR